MVCKIDRFRGLILGGAIGNAMGMPFKNLHWLQVKNLYGEEIEFFIKPHENHLNAPYSPGQYTDETQIMMLTSETIIETGEPDPEKIANKMIEIYENNEWISPGRSVLAACKNLKSGKPWKDSGSFRDGSKALAFVPPIVVCFYHDLDKMIEYIKELTRIIYTFPKVIAGGICFGYFLRSLFIKGNTPLEKIVEETAIFMEDIDSDYAEIVRWVKKLSEDNSNEALMQIGTGYSILETLPASIYSFLKYSKDFIDPIKSIVKWGDNSDTTGFLTGTMAGGFLGYEKIPQNMVEKLVDVQIFEDLAEKLFHKCCD